jgi:hypothetical protein
MKVIVTTEEEIRRRNRFILELPAGKEDVELCSKVLKDLSDEVSSTEELIQTLQTAYPEVIVTKLPRNVYQDGTVNIKDVNKA